MNAPTWTKQKAAQTALDAQNACNATALAVALHEIGRAYLHSDGTDAANTSPPFRLMLYKLNSLAGIFTAYREEQEAIDACHAIAAGKPWPPPPDNRPEAERLAELPCKGQHRPNDGSWWHRDGYGVELFRGCDDCAPVKLDRYRPDILTRYDTDDAIDSDHSADFHHDTASELAPCPSTAD